MAVVRLRMLYGLDHERFVVSPFIGSLRASRGILDQLQTLRASRGFLAKPMCELKVRFHTLQPDVS